MTPAVERMMRLAEHNWSIDMQRAVARLRAQQREALLLVFVIGLTEEEAGIELGISKMAVCLRLNNAVKNLQQLFGDRLYKNSGRLSSHV